MFLNKMLSLQNIKIGYSISQRFTSSEPLTVFSDINLQANSGQSIALIGENGVGKSTLLRTIANLQNAISGEVLIKNKIISEYKQPEIAKIISYVSTNNTNLPNLTVSELISLGRFPHTNWLGKLKQSDRQTISKSLELTEITHLADKSVNEISDGEKQRVMIARALAQNTDIIILDEPTAFLDLANKHHLSYIINKLSKDENKLVLFSTHDLNIAIKYADIIWLMLPEKIITGSPEDLILKNQFSLIFKNKNIKFDNSNADFNFDKKIIGQIEITNEGTQREIQKNTHRETQKNTQREIQKNTHRVAQSHPVSKTMDLHEYWTKKALERIGYEIQQNAKIKVIIKIKDNNIVWQLDKNNKTKTYKTISDLCSDLTGFKNLSGLNELLTN